MAFHLYNLDREAHKLVHAHSTGDILNQSHKMRMTTAYGLERFWGEHLRLGITQEEGQYWKAVWDKLEEILEPAGIQLPNEDISGIPETIKGGQERNPKLNDYTTRMVNALWEMEEKNPDQFRIALAVLIQLCDCIVWWTQRYKF